MPKIGIRKFDLDGTNKGNTTFVGEIELMLYYDGLKEYFYFKREDIKTFIPNTVFYEDSFYKCNTEQKAISMIQDEIGLRQNEKRVISLRITIDNEGYNQIKLEEHLKNGCMFQPDTYGKGSMLKLDFTYLLEYTTFNGNKVYTECDKSGKRTGYTVSPLYENKSDGIILDWSLEVENFLVNTQNEIRKMQQVLANFFNQTNNLEELTKLMSSNVKLLGEGK